MFRWKFLDIKVLEAADRYQVLFLLFALGVSCSVSLLKIRLLHADNVGSPKCIDKFASDGIYHRWGGLFTYSRSSYSSYSTFFTSHDQIPIFVLISVRDTSTCRQLSVFPSTQWLLYSIDSQDLFLIHQ